ncbi:hypothetical protein BH23VER1_BH23VER1_33780 [soil metagenome]
MTPMPTLLEQPVTIEAKARELCQSILDDPSFTQAHAQIESFLADDRAQAAYQAWREKGQELQRMGQEGLQPNDADLQQFESLKQSVLSNPVAAAFIEAEGALNEIFGSVTKLVQKTLQLGRMPADEDLAESGCCGGSGGCGCA